MLTTTIYAELLSYEVIWEWSVISSHLNPLSVWVMAVFRLLLILYLQDDGQRMGRCDHRGNNSIIFHTVNLRIMQTHSLSMRAVAFLSSWPCAQVMLSLFTRCFINVFINHVRWWFDYHYQLCNRACEMYWLISVTSLPRACAPGFNDGLV